jgi:vacuolar-type H+-ATPase subunit I/STV1
MEAALMGSDEELRAQAISQLKKKRDFHTHLFIYLLINTVLVAIWAVIGGGFFWPIFLILIWGVGIGANAWDAYMRKPLSEGRIQREVQRLRG